MRLFIPPLGTTLKLLSDWTFQLYDEYRNADLLEALGYPTAALYAKVRKKPQSVTLPKDTILVVDRIYIRKGSEGFDSVSFLIQSTQASLGPVTRIKYEPVQITPGTKSPVNQKSTKSVVSKKVHRFWSKLSDVNTLDVEIVAPANPQSIRHIAALVEVTPTPQSLKLFTHTTHNGPYIVVVGMDTRSKKPIDAIRLKVSARHYSWDGTSRLLKIVEFHDPLNKIYYGITTDLSKYPHTVLWEAEKQ